MIYEYLLDTSGMKQIYIRNKKQDFDRPIDKSVTKTRRSSYYVLERPWGRRSCESTYSIAGDKELHLSIMAVNRKIREEASHLLYGRHSFHFGDHIEAVVPFFVDRALTMNLVQDITVCKRGPMMPIESDSQVWSSICSHLKTLSRMQRLNLVIGGGQPHGDWDGPKELSVSDLRLLYATRHECLEWARELAGVDILEDVEISSSLAFLPKPKTTATRIFAAFSASIETSVVEFLRSDLGIPARSRLRPCSSVEVLEAAF